MKIWPNLLQGSDQWHLLREIRPTASNASMVITAGGKDSTSWDAYVNKLIDARVRPREVREAGMFTGNFHTDRGNEFEESARILFMERMGVDIVEVGFITRDDGIWGCSPDGLVIDPATGKATAGIEIKNPDGPKHVGHMRSGALPSEYLQQVHCSMVVSGLEAWWFMSNCEFYEPLIVEVRRDAFTAKMEDAMNRFQSYCGASLEIIPALKRKPNPEAIAV